MHGELKFIPQKNALIIKRKQTEMNEIPALS